MCLVCLVCYFLRVLVYYASKFSHAHSILERRLALCGMLRRVGVKSCAAWAALGGRGGGRGAAARGGRDLDADEPGGRRAGAGQGWAKAVHHFYTYHLLPLHSLPAASAILLFLAFLTMAFSLLCHLLLTFFSSSLLLPVFLHWLLPLRLQPTSRINASPMRCRTYATTYADSLLLLFLAAFPLALFSFFARYYVARPLSRG